MKKLKNNKLLATATILSILYFLSAWGSFLDLSSSLSETAETMDEVGSQIGTALAGALILPHLIVGTVGVIFNLFGYFTMSRGFLLTASILYAVSVALCIFWAFLLIPGMVLMFIATNKIKNKDLAAG